ncbi:endophilin-B1-like isoform X2 [Periophthalmus magnuspinnatus]|uniref:endophilin-B1-like isoform X2 n=1 Tax=Periophthalmus magnuspinnatus TaxID=409849 RepID=UPI002436A511|nr:endophilin-B1-like isoform X2 [Periophthalmus magnuspinnatus]
MDLTRLAVDAGQFINRAVQYTGETFGAAEKTELEPDIERLLAKADATKTCTDQIISQTEALLQPNPAARLEDRLYEHLEWRPPPRPRSLEVLGEIMTSAGLELGSNTPYGSALVKFGETQKQLGEAERKFAHSTNIHFIIPLRSFTEGEYRTLQDERRTLTNKRLDLDIAKTRLRKAHEADREARNLNSNPLDEDYLAHVSYMFSFIRVKWLKVGTVQAEMELRICQSLFDRQSEITKRLLTGLDDTHTNHMQSLNEFVEAQTCYFDECNQLSQELQKQLESIPAVLCSNNWQSAITNGVKQTSTDNIILDELRGSNQDNPIVLHRIPDFDQDSWTEPKKLRHNGTDPLSQSNTNFNNNNPATTESQASTHWLASNSQVTNGNSASNLKPKRHFSLLQRTDTTTVSDEPSDDSETNDEGGGVTSPALNDNIAETPNGTEANSIVANGDDEEAQTPNSEEDTKES